MHAARLADDAPIALIGSGQQADREGLVRILYEDDSGRRRGTRVGPSTTGGAPAMIGARSEIVSATANLAACRSEYREDEANYQHDDPSDPQDVHREREPEDEKDDTDKNHGSPERIGSCCESYVCDEPHFPKGA